VAAGGLGFGVTVTVWVMNGIGLAFGLAGVEPHAVRLIPAANTMAGIAITLLSFIVLPPPVQKSLISLSVSESLRSAHTGT
jgi:uncharacterized membrane protein SpoIIM required for sporulation